MATIKPKKATARRPVVNAPASDVPRDAPVDDAVDVSDSDSLASALADVYADIGVSAEAADVTIHVHLLSEDGKGTDYKVWQGRPVAFDLEAIALAHGSGRYRVMAYAKLPTGQKVRKLNEVIGWKISPAQEAQRLRSAVVESPVPAPGGDPRELVAQMFAGMDARIERLIAAQAPTTRPLDDLKTLSEVMRNMMPPAAAPGSTLKESIGMVTDLVTLSKSLSPASGGGSDGASLLLEGVRQLAPVFRDAAAANAQRQAAPASGAAAPSPAIAAPVLSDEEQELLEEQQEMGILMGMMLAAAVKAASRGKSAEEFAESRFDLLPDAILIDLCTAPDWFARLCAHAPECRSYESWFASVRAKLIDLAIESDLLARDPAGALVVLGGVERPGAASS